MVVGKKNFRKEEFCLAQRWKMPAGRVQLRWHWMMMKTAKTLQLKIKTILTGTRLIYKTNVSQKHNFHTNLIKVAFDWTHRPHNESNHVQLRIEAKFFYLNISVLPSFIYRHLSFYRTIGNLTCRSAPTHVNEWMNESNKQTNCCYNSNNNNRSSQSQTSSISTPNGERGRAREWNLELEGVRGICCDF